ncbi:ankyrin repeat domain-containing protein [bacterium]|nr:ankyrin repeat domain-containing protein [bacterium]
MSLIKCDSSIICLIVNQLESIKYVCSLKLTCKKFEDIYQYAIPEIKQEIFDFYFNTGILWTSPRLSVKFLSKASCNIKKKFNFVVKKASQFGRIEIIKIILEDPSAISVEDWSKAVEYSARCGHVKIVKILLDYKPAKSLKYNDLYISHSLQSSEAITYASKKCQSDIVKILSKNFVFELSHKLSKSQALIYASERGHIETVELLLSDRRIALSIDNYKALNLASKKGHLEVVKLLLKDRRVNSIENNYAIINASRKGHFEIVKLLLKDGRINPGNHNNFAIQVASAGINRKGYSKKGLNRREDQNDKFCKIVEILLADKRVHPERCNNQAIIWASQNGNIGAVKLLLNDPRVKPSARKNCAIKSAYNNSERKIVKLLFDSPKFKKCWGDRTNIWSKIN